ncbi:hypothetical protein BSKO_00579 [Bryopsis sp. KO-2023]|nr:hypothetical protein BSKO_00579 [Bryopsis sp. KO-2023]
MRGTAFQNSAMTSLSGVPVRGCRLRLSAPKPSRAKFGVVRAAYGEDPTCDASTYLSLGLATCFEKTKEGKLAEKAVIEPVAAASLESLANGAATSFTAVTGVTLEDALQRNREILPEEFSSGLFCEDYVFRCNAAARTWTRSHAQDNLMDIVPLGQVKSNFNFSVEHKRVLNFENVVDDDDNIKQDMSIDVYGRQKEEEYAEAQAAKDAETKAAEEKKKKAEEEEEDDEDDEEDDLDSLLVG